MNFANFVQRTYDSKNDYVPARYQLMTKIRISPQNPSLVTDPEHLQSRDVQHVKNVFRDLSGPTRFILVLLDLRTLLQM